MKTPKNEAARTLKAARRAARAGDTKRAQALVAVAEEFRLLAEGERGPVGFSKGRSA